MKLYRSVDIEINMYNKIIIRLKKKKITIGSSKMVYSCYCCLRETMERKKGKMKGRAIPRVDGDLINGLDVCYFGRLEGWQWGGRGRSV